MIDPITGISGRGVRRSANQIAGFSQQCQVRWADDINTRSTTVSVYYLLSASDRFSQQNMDNGISPAKKAKVTNGSNVSRDCLLIHQFNET